MRAAVFGVRTEWGGRPAQRLDFPRFGLDIDPPSPAKAPRYAFKGSSNIAPFLLTRTFGESPLTGCPPSLRYGPRDRMPRAYADCAIRSSFLPKQHPSQWLHAGLVRIETSFRFAYRMILLCPCLLVFTSMASSDGQQTRSISTWPLVAIISAHYYRNEFY